MPNSLKSEADFLLKDGALDLAHKMSCLEDSRFMLEQQRRVTEAHNKTLLPNYQPSSDDMGDLILGDRVTNTLSPPSGLGNIAKIALATGLMATGIGLPVGAAIALPAVLDFFKQPAPTSTTVPGDGWDSKVGMQVIPPDSP